MSTQHDSAGLPDGEVIEVSETDEVTAEHAALKDAVARANSEPHDALMADALAWARSVRLHALLLDMVLAGCVDILASPEGGDLSFRQRGAPNVIPFGPASRRVRPRRNSG